MMKLRPGADSGGGAWFFTRNTSKIFAPPSEIEKIWFFGVKSWFFTRNTPKIFAPPSARRNFFKCAPPYLKSWIRPWRQCSKTRESQENGHFSLNNGANSSWIRNSAISYGKKKFDLYTNTRKCCLLLFK